MTNNNLQTNIVLYDTTTIKTTTPPQYKRMPSTKEQLAKLQEVLRSVESHTLPPSLQDAISSSESSSVSASLDPALIARYQTARDLYLRRHVQQTFLSHLSTFNGESFGELPDVPTAEQEEALQQQLQQVRQSVTQGAQSAHQQLLELKYKYETFALRRQELQQMVQDMAAKNDNKEDDDDTDIMDTDEDVDDDEDEALAAQEERLEALQQKKARLEIQLQKLRQETGQIEQKTEQINQEVEQMMDGKPGEPNSPTNLQQEVAETEEQLKQLNDMQALYDNYLEAMEELAGIKVLCVRRAYKEEESSPEQQSDDEANKRENDQQKVPGIEMHLRLLDEHEILITLRSSNGKDAKELRVVGAKFLTDTLVRAPTGEETTEHGDSEHQPPVIEMTIPPLDDLVQICECFPPAEELRFLVRETMARIRMVEARVVDLNLLNRSYVAIVGKYHKTTDDSFGGEEQEVVVSLEECITLRLRLTADFPCIPGSVYIFEMVGTGGWDDEYVDKIKQRVSQTEYSSAVSLIEQVQHEIVRLQDEENLSVPKTPMLPTMRRKNN